MSNILIIKHGSLGDIIQANGAIKDIKKIFLIAKYCYSRHLLTQTSCLLVHT